MRRPCGGLRAPSKAGPVRLIGLLVAPARVEPMVRGLNSWLDRNGKRVGIDVLGVVGLILIVRGTAQLVAI